MAILCYVAECGEPWQVKGCRLAVFPTMEELSNGAGITGIICRHLEKRRIQFEKVLLCVWQLLLWHQMDSVSFWCQCNREVKKTSDSKGSADWIICGRLLLQKDTCKIRPPPHNITPHLPLDTESNKVRLLLMTTCPTLDSPPLCTIRTNVVSCFRWEIMSRCQIKTNGLCSSGCSD